MIRFGLLTALRRDEFAELAWSEVDMAKRRITISAERMKNREEHTLPLSDDAFAILSNRPRDGPLVFPTQVGKPYLNWTPLLRRIRECIGESDRPLAQRFRLHDIRRSFNSILCEEGFSEDALDLMLAHKRTGMKAIYNLAKLMPERGRAFARWARLLTELEKPTWQTALAMSYPLPLDPLCDLGGGRMAIRAAGFLRRLSRLAPAPPGPKATKKSTIPNEEARQA